MAPQRRQDPLFEYPTPVGRNDSTAPHPERTLHYAQAVEPKGEGSHRRKPDGAVIGIGKHLWRLEQTRCCALLRRSVP